MDLATFIGIISGIGLVVWAILSNSGLEIFINAPSLAVVFGGTIAATFIAYPLNEVLRVLSILKNVFFSKTIRPIDKIKELVEISTVTRKNGILALDKELPKISDDFLKKGLQMVVDGIRGATISSVMQLEMDNVWKRHQVGHQLFKDMAAFSPAFGMVGTLIGLVQMLADLSDPGSIGPKMAVALITTFYGSLFANLLFLPMSIKLKRRSQQETLRMTLTIEGIKSIRLGDNPRFMEEKLTKFLSQAERQKTNKADTDKKKSK